MDLFKNLGTRQFDFAWLSGVFLLPDVKILIFHNLNVLTLRTKRGIANISDPTNINILGFVQTQRIRFLEWTSHCGFGSVWTKVPFSLVVTS